MKKSIFFVLVFVLFLGSCENDSNFIQNELKFKETKMIEKAVDSTLRINLGSHTHFFEFDTSKDTVILGEQGTKIFLKPDSFHDSIKTVFFELKEVFSIYDMISNRLTTFTDDNNVLITQGMVHLSFKNENGEKIEIENPIRIDIPTENKDPDMKLYFGKENANGDIVWINNPREFEKPIDTLVSYSFGLDSIDHSYVVTHSTTVEDYRDFVYSFYTSSQGWHNIDKIYDSDDFLDFNITTNSGRKILFYLVYKGFTMIYTYSKDSNINSFSIGTKAFVNSPFYLVGIRKVSHQDNRLLFYIGEHEVNQDNNVIDVNVFDTLTKTEVKRRLLEVFGEDVREGFSPNL